MPAEPFHVATMTAAPELRPYQREAVEAVEGASGGRASRPGRGEARRCYSATERQLEVLRRVRDLSDQQLAGMSGGEASDLLDVVIAADRLARARRRRTAA